MMALFFPPRPKVGFSRLLSNHNNYIERDIQPLQKLLCTAEQNAAVHDYCPCAPITGPILPIGETSSDRSLEPTVGPDCPVNGVVRDNNNNRHEAAASVARLVSARQTNGPWPSGHPLPLPRWASAPVRPLRLADLREYEELASEIEMHLRRVLEEHNYDTVVNWMKFYERFKGSACDSVLEFFHMYSPPITPEHYTCVGLALELWNRLSIQLEAKYPGIGDHLCLVSCEEDIVSTPVYTAALSDRLDSASYTLEKEHVLMCLNVEFSGRSGTLLCDPGYHVSRVVNVMADKAYPNTGWFIQSEESGIRKEYNYTLSSNNDDFVEWKERTTRNGEQENFTGLIYIGRPYLTAVDVTERRNLAYNFRSLLSRDQKGHLIAGIYFKVFQNSDEFTIFYQDMGKQRIKMSFSAFLRPKVKDDLLKKLSICNEQLNLPKNKLLDIVRTSGQILKDGSYLRQILEIEGCINIMSANN
ncbi:hypothetical protein NQ317_007293 [Molorchus minor]|uniref:Uncharacterized protein n=1 Tax=Molorchus minor TaxID=1323400 RepID=A0ABQ9JUB3_9CUCU|nr:hypothetical protein NQ317_007293 [Molorchus minor]